MNKLFILFVLSAFLVTSCNFVSGVNGNGVVAEENRSVKSFTSIDVSGNIKVLLLPSSEPYVKLYADENLLELISTKSNGKELKIHPTERIGKFEKLMVEIGIDELQGIDISGAVDLSNQGTIRGRKLDLDCSGAAEIDLDVKVEELIVDLSGAGDIDLSGKTEDLKMEISGAAEVISLELLADNVDLDVSGAAYCKVFARKSLEVEASGAADVVYDGNPKKLRINNSGASNVRAL